jgi:hypothetical protein
MSLPSQHQGSEFEPPEMKTASMGDLTLGKEGCNRFAEASVGYSGTSEESGTSQKSSVENLRLGVSTIHDSAAIEPSTSSSAGHCSAFSSFPSFGGSRTAGEGPSTNSAIAKPDINRTEDSTNDGKVLENFSNVNEANQQSQAIIDDLHPPISSTAPCPGRDSLATPAAFTAESANDPRVSTSPTNQELVMETVKSDLQTQMSAACSLLKALEAKFEAERTLRAESEATFKAFKAESEADRIKYRLDVKFGCEGELRNLSAQMMKTALQQRYLKLNSTSSEYVGKLSTSQSQSHMQKILAEQHSLEPDEFARKMDQAISVRNLNTHFDNQTSLLQCVLKFQIFLKRHDYLLEDPDVGFLATVIMKYDDWQAVYPKKLAPSPSAAHKASLDA